MILFDDNLDALLDLLQHSMKITGKVGFSDADSTHDFDHSVLPRIRHLWRRRGLVFGLDLLPAGVAVVDDLAAGGVGEGGVVERRAAGTKGVAMTATSTHTK